MSGENIAPERFSHLLVLLQNLPKVPTGNRYYRATTYDPLPADFANGDGTEIGAVHQRLTDVFIIQDRLTFLERGEGLDKVVAVLEDAYQNKNGDKNILRRWVDQLITGALEVYKEHNVKPSEAKRQRVESVRAKNADQIADKEGPKRKAQPSDTTALQPASKKTKPSTSGTKKTVSVAALKKLVAKQKAGASHAKVATSTPPAGHKGDSNATKTASSQQQTLPFAKKKGNDSAAASVPDAMDLDDDDEADKDFHPPRSTYSSDDDEAMSDDDDVVDVESDGESALRAVKEAEAQSQAGNRRGPKSGTLQYWNDPVKIVSGKKLKWEFKCKFCKATRSFNRSKDCESFDDEKPRPATANLTSHVKKDHPDAAEQLSKLEGPGETVPAAHGYTPASAKLMGNWLKQGALNPKVAKTYGGFLRHFAAWILDENLAFTTGESLTLQNLFKYLDITYALPTDTTVRNELARLYAGLHRVVVKELAGVKSRIAYATDTWTPKQMLFTFAGTIASFIDDDWQLVERVVDFACLQDRQHEGVYAGQAFVDSAAGRGGLNKMLSLTMDNASVNDVMARSIGFLLLKRYGVSMHEDNARVRCLPHVVNLVVQKMLSVLLEADDPEDIDYYTADKDVAVHFDPALDEDQVDFESRAEADEAALKREEAETKATEDSDVPDTEDETRYEALIELIGTLEDDEEVVSSPVKKLRIICTKVVSSPQRRAKFRRHVAAAYPNKKDLHGLMVVRDVATRWNSTHAMMVRALRLTKAVDAWAFDHRGELGSKILLTADDWKTLGHMRDLLEVFPEVTLAMSQSAQPTSPWVLPMYDLMKSDLTARSKNESIPRKIRSAATAGLEKLQQYHELAEKNHYMWLATILHPALRHWFNPRGLAERALAILTHAHNSYKERAAALNPLPQAAAKSTPSSGSILDRILGTTVEPVAEEPELNEVQRYLRGWGKSMATHDNALIWWKQNEKDLPVLAMMARDFLAIPASSTSVERLFSRSGYLVTKQRSSMSAETIRQCMCTKSWIRDGLMGRLQ